MANRNHDIATNCARLRSTPTTTSSRRNNNRSVNMEDVDENDVMMQGDDDANGNDNNSIPSTMCVRASRMEFGNRNRSASNLRDGNENYASNDNISVAGNVSSFFIPLPTPVSRKSATSVGSTEQEQQQEMNLGKSNCEDDISILTEYSMDESEDDNLSQTTANTTWTCVTEGTDSTTAAAPKITRRNNFGVLVARKLALRRTLSSKRTRVQQSQEAGNLVLFRDNKSNGGSEQLKRRRKA